MKKVAPLEGNQRQVFWFAAGLLLASCGGKSSIEVETLPGGPLSIGSSPKVDCSVYPCAKRIAAGDTHACALFESGSVACWGSNVSNQTGQVKTDVGDTVSQPRRVTEVQSAISITAAGSSTCTVMAGGFGQCWGPILRQLQSAPALEYLPTELPGALVEVVINKGADKFLCVRTVDNTVECLGDNSYGQLGNGIVGGTSKDFVQVQGLGTVRALGVGYSHVCALSSEPAHVFCWGDNMFGAVGPPFAGLAGGTSSDTDNVSLPREVMGVSNPVVVTGVNGSRETCILDQQGATTCWGMVTDPSNGEPITVWPPKRTFTEGGLKVDLTDTASELCGISAEQQLVCARSGVNSSLINVVQLACGAHFCCVLQGNGQVQCFGSNADGQLGTGTVDDTVHEPVAPDFSAL